MTPLDPANTTHRPGRLGPTPPRGFTLVELLATLAIAALLATAMAAAVHASFIAYATNSESAVTQTSARLVMQRTLAAIRKSTLHDAYDPDDPSATLLAPSDSGHPLTCVGLEMVLPDASEMRLWWAVNASYGDEDLGDLWYDDPNWTSQQPVVMLQRVRCRRDGAGEPYVFTLASRTSDAGLLLSRATVDLTVEPDVETLTDAEQAKAATAPIRLVASTMPRKSLDE